MVYESFPPPRPTSNDQFAGIYSFHMTFYLYFIHEESYFMKKLIM